MAFRLLDHVGDNSTGIAEVVNATDWEEGPADEHSVSFGGASLVAALIMLTIVGLLYLWEVFVHTLHKITPPSLLPAVEYSLAEIGGLGFIGLLLEISQFYVAEVIEEEVLEIFEFLHTCFFKVAIGYFAYCAFLVWSVMVQIKDIRALEREETNQQEKAHKHSVDVVVPETSFWKELTNGFHDRSKEFLLERHRFLRKYNLPENFYLNLTDLFSTYLEKLIHFKPSIWLPLIPVLALGEAIDITNDVSSPGAENATASAGFFYSNRSVWAMVLLWQATTLILCLFNFCCMVQYKNCAIRHGNAAHAEEHQENEKTSLMSADTTTGNPREFIPAFHVTSIQYHSWFAITSVVLIFTIVLIRDVRALVFGLEVGDPQHLVPETIAYSFFCVFNLFQLALTPRIFWTFCLTNFDADKVSKKVIRSSMTKFDANEEAMQALRKHMEDVESDDDSNHAH